MRYAIFMRHFLSFIFLVTFVMTFSQNALNGHSWQYFNHDSTYFEMTFSGKYVYLYADSGSVFRHKWSGDHATLTFNKSKWQLIKSNDTSVFIRTDSGHLLTLYKADFLKTELISFYGWGSATHRNGNGYMIFWRDATERKRILKSRH